MVSAKDLIVAPIKSADANALVKRVHYSGKIVQNSQLHFGVFLNGKLEGAMQFGPSLDKRKMLGLVSSTGWNEFIELNRIAFSDRLPKNSESRAISVAIKILKKHAQHLKWIVSFSDASQCGDGAIYRASGFLLTGIKQNDQIIEFPDGHRETRLVLTDARRPRRRIEMAKKYGAKIGAECSLRPFIEVGARAIPGYQLRYVYFIDKSYIEKLTVPVMPFSRIDEIGAGMYKGKKVSRAGSIESDASTIPVEQGGAVPTSALQYGDDYAETRT